MLKTRVRKRAFLGGRSGMATELSGDCESVTDVIVKEPMMTECGAA